MGKLFGTDGIRGIVGDDLTVQLAYKVGLAAAYVLGKEKENLTVLIGKDTRVSRDVLSTALTAGLLNSGANVIDLGIVPTPAVSYLIKKYNASMGVMISASHNPSEYNGIKLFDENGFKLPDETEEKIEKYLLGEEIPSSNKIGNLSIKFDAIEDYTDYLVSTVENINKDLKIVVDCANGSASTTAKVLFEKLGLKPNIININFDGYNINDNCGSTHMEKLIETVLNTKADLGIAYDGDADRCLMVDDQGNLIDGDFILAIAGNYLKEKNELDNNTIVGTIMSNLGLKKFCENNDINFVATKVGDRYVLENMLENGNIIGGEQSGHVIFKKHANTGDGELTSIQILNIMTKTNKSLKELASIIESYPQVLINVEVTKEGKEHFLEDEDIICLKNEIEDSLNGEGRVLLRASGTEYKIRVMLEGKDINDITSKAQKLADLIKEKYGK